MDEGFGDETSPYQEALVYESIVMPRYGQPFGDLVVQSFRSLHHNTILDISCRAGQPSLTLLATLGGDSRVVGIDADTSFLEVAQARAGLEAGRRFFVQQGNPEQLEFDAGVFSHVIGNLVDRVTTDRGVLLRELNRILAPRGQLVLSMPLRGSFEAVLDMFREVALKHDLAAVGERVEQYASSLPSKELWQEELSAQGFDHISVKDLTFMLDFESSAELFADPAMFVAAIPEWRWCAAATEAGTQLLFQVQETIDTYFRGRRFQLEVIAGCASAWRSAG